MESASNSFCMSAAADRRRTFVAFLGVLQTTDKSISIVYGNAATGVSMKLTYLYCAGSQEQPMAGPGPLRDASGGWNPFVEGDEASCHH
jgi:hypothetical protein